MVKLAWFALLAAPNEQLDAALLDGLAAARSLDELAPQNPVVALALAETESDVIAGAEAGARLCPLHGSTAGQNRRIGCGPLSTRN